MQRTRRSRPAAVRMRARVSLRPRQSVDCTSFRDALRFSASLALLAAALAPATASAAFTAPFTLSPAGQDVDQQSQVAIDAQGDALAVWMRYDGTGPCGARGCLRVQARARSAAGSLGPVQTLSAAGQDGLFPQVAVDADGDALIVWSRLDGTAPSGPCGEGGCLRAQARARSATGVLGPVQTLSPAGQYVENPHVGMDADGDAVVGWGRRDDFRAQLRARSAAGVLGPVQTISPAGQAAGYPQVAVDAAGDALAVWVNDVFRVQARARSATGSLSQIQTLSPAGKNASNPEVAVDPDGDALVVWERLDGTSSDCCLQVQSRPRSAAGVLGSIQTLSAPVGTETFPTVPVPQVAVDGDGDAVVVWTRFNGTSSPVELRARSAAGVLGSVQTLSPNGVDHDVGIDTGGNAVAVWRSFVAANLRAQARTRSAAGVLGSVQTLSPAGQDVDFPRIAVEPNGDAIAAWNRFDGSSGACCVRVQGAAGP